MEILHLVGGAIVISESAVAHSQPHRARHFRHLYSRHVILGHEHHLRELLHVARLLVDARDALAAGGYPYCAVAVAEDGVDGFAGVLDESRLLTVGTFENSARLGADIYVVAVGIHRRDALLAQKGILTQCLVVGAKSAHAFVCAHPKVAFISFHDNRRLELTGGDQFVLKSPFRVFHLVYSHAFHYGEHLALRRYRQGVLCL